MVCSSSCECLFGTCNSLATFQRMLVLHGLNWKECLAYLDDVIVLGNSVDNHLLNLKTVLSGFRKHNLKLTPPPPKKPPLYIQKRDTVFGQGCQCFRDPSERTLCSPVINPEKPKRSGVFLGVYELS